MCASYKMCLCIGARWRVLWKDWTIWTWTVYKDSWRIRRDWAWTYVDFVLNQCVHDLNVELEKWKGFNTILRVHVSISSECWHLFPPKCNFLWQSHLPRLREQHCYVLDEQTEQHRVLFLNGLVFVAAISRSQLRHWISKTDRILYIGNISFQGTIVFPSLGVEVSKMQFYWIGNEMDCLRFERMNRCIVSRDVDQVLVARIDREPCACMRLLEHKSSSTCLILNTPALIDSWVLN